jgi:DNA-binding NtrC family response regulator
MRPRVLVVDDDRSVLHLIQRTLEAEGVDVLTARCAAEALDLLAEQRPDAVLMDVMLPETSGLEAFEIVRQKDPKLPVIFITSCNDSETAIEAIKGGAHDYLFKPLDVAKIRSVVQQALETRRLMQVPVVMQDEPAGADDGDFLIGCSPQMLEVYKAIGLVAPQDVTVLIVGESGTGKELIARAIYQHSPRAKGPFLAVNCAAIHETLLESELFGHEKGAFTGADQRRIGKFEHCSGGTLFLDEVGDMSPMLQSKLLRVLQEQRFERVGGNTTIQTDTRIIAATNRNLSEMVAEGAFREDLYYRLTGFTIELPPLRQREGDLELLVGHFVRRFARKLGKEVAGISPEAMQILKRHRWPGNVRELQSVLKQALLHATGPLILPDFLPRSLLGAAEKHGGLGGESAAETDLARFVQQRLEAESTDLYAEALQWMERYLLSRVLTQCEGKQSAAAKVLGITRGSLRHKLRALGISVEQVVNVEAGGNAVDEPDEAPAAAAQ